MADQLLLSDLCSICHVNTPKYRCPACSTRTCSLECVQVHKQRGCSGKRDPTAYVKKSQLATPAGVDHDYNFIAGIERSRDRAGERLLEHDIAASHARSHGLNNAGFINRQRLAGVKIEYAPVGMSRQKLNKTRFSKSRRIFWTVEWIHDDQTTTIGAILDDVPISQEYSTVYLKRLGQQSTRKRKRENAAVFTSTDTLEPCFPQQGPMDDDRIVPEPFEGGCPPRDNDQGSTSPIQNQQSLPTNPNLVSTQVTDLADQVEESITHGQREQSHRPDKTDSNVDALIPKDSDVKADSKSMEKAKDSPSSLSTAVGSPDQYGLHYYLVKPRTTGSQQVLVPLSPADSFLTCLRDQTVLEFPSIQILLDGPNALPASFITESDYSSRLHEETLGMEQIIEEEGELTLHHAEPRTNHERDKIDRTLDPSAIIAKLEQDIQHDRG